MRSDAGGTRSGRTAVRSPRPRLVVAGMSMRRPSTPPCRAMCTRVFCDCERVDAYAARAVTSCDPNTAIPTVPRPPRKLRRVDLPSQAESCSASWSWTHSAYSISAGRGRWREGVVMTARRRGGAFSAGCVEGCATAEQSMGGTRHDSRLRPEMASSPSRGGRSATMLSGGPRAAYRAV